MSNVIDILRDQYNAVISQDTDWGFFVALVGYINYVLETPTLKTIADKVMEKKIAEYAKLARLEDKALEELERAKIKLLKIVNDCKIAPDSLPRTHSFSFQPNNVLKDLELFEKGDISKGGFKSEHIESYLFDIASGILKQGHKDSLKDFIVSGKEYRDYYNNPDSDFLITGNINGNFIFSKTLKLRREQSKLIERAEKFELWGTLNELLKLQKAFLEKSENKSFYAILQKYGDDAKTYQEAGDATDIVFFAEDLEALAESKKSRFEYKHLIRSDFSQYASTVNAYLIKELAKIGTEDERMPSQDKNYLKSINLITDSLEPQSVIFLVLDERFEMPIRCAVNNNDNSPAYIKKLYDIAYSWDVPNKKVDYDKSLADDINNGLFKRRRVAEYMKTNKLKKPTLVQKSEDRKSLVLKNEIPITTALIKNIVPMQCQSLYIDKTK